MQGLMSNPRMILDYIGHHIAMASRVPVKLPFLFIKDGEDYYCLKVSGDSMMGAHDQDEETVLIKRTAEAKHDDIIVGVVDGAPMLKKYKKFENRVELHSANSNEQPIIVTEENDFRIAGIFVGHFSE